MTVDITNGKCARVLGTPRKLARLAQASAVQWLPKTAIDRLQLARLRRLVIHAEANVPLYAERFRRAGVQARNLHSLEDFAAFPLLTREEVVSAWPDRILSRAVQPNDVMFRTSGTSGMFMHIAYSASANDFLDAIYGRALFATGYRPWDRIAYFWWDAAPKAIRSYERVGLMKKHLLPVHADPHRQLADLEALRPDVIYHFPSSLLLLAKILERTPSTTVRPRLIICHGELMTPEQQAIIGAAFRCEVFNQYGAQEFNRMGWDCSEHRGLHVDADSVLIEVVRDGVPVPLGEEGELVVTGLMNPLMPLVRYRIGDLGRLLPESCPCGRNLPLLVVTEGRSDDLLSLPDGTRIGPRTLAPRIEDVPGFMQYRLIQTARDQVVISIVREPNAPADVERRVHDVIASVLGPSVRIEVKSVDEISLSRRGKLRKIIRAIEA